MKTFRTHKNCDRFCRFPVPATLQLRSLIINLTMTFRRCICAENMPTVAQVCAELFCTQELWQILSFFCSRELKTISRSWSNELDWDLYGMHLLCEYGDSSSILLWIVAIFVIFLSPLTLKLGQGHWVLNFTETSMHTSILIQQIYLGFEKTSLHVSIHWTSNSWAYTCMLQSNVT